MRALFRVSSKRLFSAPNSVSSLSLRRFCSTLTSNGFVHPTAIVHPNAVLGEVPNLLHFSIKFERNSVCGCGLWFLRSGCFSWTLLYHWVVREGWKWLPVASRKPYFRKYRSWGWLCFDDVSLNKCIVDFLPFWVSLSFRVFKF